MDTVLQLGSRYLVYRFGMMVDYLIKFCDIFIKHRVMIFCSFPHVDLENKISQNILMLRPQYLEWRLWSWFHLHD